MPVDVVLIADLELCQNVAGCRCEALSTRLRVDEYGLAALGIVLQAVQYLNAGRRLIVPATDTVISALIL